MSLHERLKPETEPERDLGIVLARLSTECADLAIGLDALQDLLARLVSDADRPLDSSTIKGAQDIDRITQTLRCLSGLSAECAVRVNGVMVPRADLSRAINLQSVAERLLD